MCSAVRAAPHVRGSDPYHRIALRSVSWTTGTQRNSYAVQLTYVLRA